MGFVSASKPRHNTAEWQFLLPVFLCQWGEKKKKNESLVGIVALKLNWQTKYLQPIWSFVTALLSRIFLLFLFNTIYYCWKSSSHQNPFSSSCIKILEWLGLIFCWLAMFHNIIFHLSLRGPLRIQIQSFNYYNWWMQIKSNWIWLGS